MATDEDDDSARRFVHWEGLGTLSNAAFMLHGSGVVESVRAGSPGWIDDEWLAAIPADSTTAAVELETAGVWERDGEGYRINDLEAIAKVVEMHERMERTSAECRSAGAHKPDSRGEYCTHCLAPLS